jgi:hypothetical protein
MATTTNYNWSTPDDTALVKDGAAAIRSLGTAIDATVFNNAGAAIAKTIVDAKGDLIVATAADTVARLASSASNGDLLTVDTSTATGLKWATPVTPASGLTLVKTQTIGSGVSTVTVTDAFSATYDNYKIIISGGVGSGSSGLHMQLGATTSGYYTVGLYQYAHTGVGAISTDKLANYSEFVGMGNCSVNSIGSNIEVNSPYLTKPTTVSNNDIRCLNSDANAEFYRGFVDNTTSYTDFKIFCGSGGITMTGGTIKVYGYQNS